MSEQLHQADPVPRKAALRGWGPDRPARSRHGGVIVMVALGGGLGALARHGLARLMPTPNGGFPWATFAANVLGCLLIGVLMVLITEVWAAHRLLRPFLGVGLLGGFTTFSTYAVGVTGLLRAGSMGAATGYLAGTLLCAMLAVIVGVWVARWATGAARPTREVH